MVKHTQKIRRQKPTNCLSVFDHFVKLELKDLKQNLHELIKSIRTAPLNLHKLLWTPKISCADVSFTFKHVIDFA